MRFFRNYIFAAMIASLLPAIMFGQSTPKDSAAKPFPVYGPAVPSDFIPPLSSLLTPSNPISILPPYVPPKASSLAPRPLTPGQLGTCQLIRERYDPPNEWKTTVFDSEEKKLEALRKFPLKGEAKCSGSVISRRHFLTSAHCVDEILSPGPYHQREPITPKNGWVIVGRILCNRGKEQHLFWKDAIDINADFFQNYSNELSVDRAEYDQFCRGRSPEMVKKYLSKAHFPATPTDLYNYSVQTNAPPELAKVLKELPNQWFSACDESKDQSKKQTSYLPCGVMSVAFRLQGLVDIKGRTDYSRYNCAEYESLLAKEANIRRIADDQAMIKTFEPFGNSCPPDQDCVPTADLPNDEEEITGAAFCEAYGYSGLDATKGDHAHYAKLVFLDKLRLGSRTVLDSLVQHRTTVSDPNVLQDILHLGISDNIQPEDSGGPIYCQVPNSDEPSGTSLVMMGTISNIKVPFKFLDDDDNPITKLPPRLSDGQEIARDGSAWLTRGTSIRRLIKAGLLQRYQRNEP